MDSEKLLRQFFPVLLTEVDYVKKTYEDLKSYGFSYDNSIAATCICRDEISQTLRSIIKHIWGEAFNLSSLAGMFFAGKTGLLAAMHHAPIVGGRERYVFYALPHIAVDKSGRLGVCLREGREGESTACGALYAFHKELESGRLNLTMDYEDTELSLIRMRLLREIPYGKVPDLIELTRITQQVVKSDLETILKKVVRTEACDYAVFTGIQVHGPEKNYVWPATSYVVVDGRVSDIAVGSDI